MKEIKLTQGKVALVDDEDYEYINQWKWCAHKCGRAYYADRCQTGGKNRVHLKMHRIIMNCEKYGGIMIDHIDGNGLNNQKSNLRFCTCQENNRNRKSSITSTSKYLGVCLVNKKTSKKDYFYFQAQILINRKKTHLGLFKNEKDAAIAYNNSAKFNHGDFAKLNVIE